MTTKKRHAHELSFFIEDKDNGHNTIDMTQQPYKQYDIWRKRIEYIFLHSTQCSMVADVFSGIFNVWRQGQ